MSECEVHKLLIMWSLKNSFSVLSEQVLSMFQAYPSLIVDHCSEITDFVTLRNLSQAKEEFFLHMVSGWGNKWPDKILVNGRCGW